MTEGPIFVTKPSLPPLDELIPFLQEIWDKRVLTNGGPFHQQLESALSGYLGVPHISLFNNGTNALITALQALDLKGDVITTPYTFVATADAIVWNGLRPVFADVQPDTLNLDPRSIEAAITPATSAIVPVHCYGQPCDVDAIDFIAAKKGLKVVYDAAHAFGVKHGGESVLKRGDLSVLSFHATKVFNTFEGGAIVSPTFEMKQRIDQLKNFGYRTEETIDEVGLNGKMNEFSAALGLVQLQHVGSAIQERAGIDRLYRARLEGVREVRCLAATPDGNYSYFPILLEGPFAARREAFLAQLKAAGIYARRYFYPLITDYAAFKAYVSAATPVAAAAARAVLCLPIYTGLQPADVERIVAIIRQAARAA